MPLVGDFMSALDAKKSVLVVVPTHIEGDEITAAIRDKLKERGIVKKDEAVFETLKRLDWTEAEKGDPEQFDGTEVVQWHRNSGSFRAGDQVRVADLKTGQSLGRPQHYSVYSQSSIGLAAGDQIRITANGNTDGKQAR